jgi:hypothetical protein
MVSFLLPVLHTLVLMMWKLTLTSAWTGTMQRSRSRLDPRAGHRRLDTRRLFFLNQQLFRSSSSSSLPTKAHDNDNDGVDQQQQQIPAPHNIAIVGGGLAGLSTAFHLLEKTVSLSSRCRVTIFDTAHVGTAGASSVAGGYVPYMESFCYCRDFLLCTKFMLCYSSVIIDIFATLD